jgi:hypothetical protein
MRQERGTATDPPSERVLAAAGGAGLLAIALLGPASLALTVLALAVVVVAVIGGLPWTRDRGPLPIVRAAHDDRWRVWRHVEPDAEFLRGGRRRRRAA